jgi:hypothetical protein
MKTTARQRRLDNSELSFEIRGTNNKNATKDDQ